MKTLLYFEKGIRPTKRLAISLEWKLQDFWIGAFWKRGYEQFDLWICIIPCLPIHFSIDDPSIPF